MPATIGAANDVPLSWKYAPPITQVGMLSQTSFPAPAWRLCVLRGRALRLLEPVLGHAAA